MFAWPYSMGKSYVYLTIPGIAPTWDNEGNPVSLGVLPNLKIALNLWSVLTDQNTCGKKAVYAKVKINHTNDVHVLPIIIIYCIIQSSKCAYM